MEKLETKHGIYYINGMPDEMKEEYQKYRGNGEYYLCLNKINFFNSKHIQEDITGYLWDMLPKTQPSEKTVKKALLWSYGDNYKIKAGGESMSDELFSSSFLITIMDEDYLDKDVVLIKKHSTNFKDVLITEKEIKELYYATENDTLKKERRKNNLYGYISVLMRMTQGISITNNGNTLFETDGKLDKILSNVKSEYSDEEIKETITNWEKEYRRWMERTVAGNAQKIATRNKHFSNQLNTLQKVSTLLIA